MAASADPVPRGPEIIDLRRFSGYDLSPLLQEEAGEWARELWWDFRGSADLVRRFADARSLGGFGLVEGGEIAGYGYTVLENGKGLIGDIFVRPASRTVETQVRLFRALLDHLISTPRVSRIESQLMLIEPEVARAIQRERFIRLFERLIMTFDPATELAPGADTALRRFHVEPWRDYHHDSAATVISLAYLNHIDAQINDQYRTLDGARRFLYNIVQFPGCGTFYPAASFIASERATGWVAGIVLSSFVSAGVAHVTQLCVTPHAQNAGLGYELLRQAVSTLREAGARRITLTVTAANKPALDLYLRCGFQEARRFFAYVWESY